MRKSGSMSMDNASSATRGTNTDAAAAFDVNSVMMPIITASAGVIAQ